jgi:DNA-binding transcriptional regulator GbsR (MarR family)
LAIAGIAASFLASPVSGGASAGAGASIITFMASGAFQMGLGIAEATFDSTTSIVDGDNIGSTLAWNFLPLGIGVIGSAVGKGLSKARTAIINNFMKIGIVADVSDKGTIVIRGLAKGTKGYGKTLLQIKKVLGDELTTKLKAGQLLSINDLNKVLDRLEKQTKKWLDTGLSEQGLARALGSKVKAKQIHKYYADQPKIIQGIKKEIEKTKVLQRFIEQRKGQLFYTKQSGYTITDSAAYRRKLDKISAVKQKYSNIKNEQVRKLLIDAELNQYRAMKKIINGIKKLLEAPKNLINVANEKLRKKLVRSVVDKNYRKLPASPKLRKALNLGDIDASKYKNLGRTISETEFTMPKWLSIEQQKIIERAAGTQTPGFETVMDSVLGKNLGNKEFLEKQLEATIRYHG